MNEIFFEKNGKNAGVINVWCLCMIETFVTELKFQLCTLWHSKFKIAFNSISKHETIDVNFLSLFINMYTAWWKMIVKKHLLEFYWKMRQWYAYKIAEAEKTVECKRNLILYTNNFWIQDNHAWYWNSPHRWRLMFSN